MTRSSKPAAADSHLPTLHELATEDAVESENDFQLFLQTLEDFITVATDEGEILFTNRALQQKLGYGEDELLSMHVWDISPLSDRNRVHQIVSDLLLHERSSSTLPFLTKEGSVLELETRVWRGTWKGQRCIFSASKDLTAEQEAKRRFELIFRNSPMPMALTSLPQRHFIDINEAFLKLTGFEREELIGQTSKALGLFADPKTFERVNAEISRTGYIRDLAVHVRCKNGKLCDGLFSGEPIKGSTSNYFLTVFVDLTAQKRAELALKQERERLESIISAAHIGTWEWNIKTGETLINEYWATILGYTLEELSPVTIQTWRQLVHPEDSPICDTALAKHISGEANYYEIELRMKHKSGDWVWILTRGQITQRDATGAPLRLMGIHKEITARKQAEMEISRLSHIQQELMRLATDFVNVPTESQDQAIQQSLATMGRLIHADRAYLFSYDWETGTSSNTHEWCNTGISPAINNLQKVPMSYFPEWFSAHQKGELIHISHVSDISPETHPHVRHILDTQGVLSLIALPMMQNGVCIGFVGFDAVQEPRIWKEDEVNILRVLAELYAHFESRRNSERKMLELQQRLTEARDRAEKSALAKTLFIANVSHEIRTPLNAILGYAQVIARECHSCEIAHRTNGLTKSSEHLLTLINDVLELARSDGQQITLNNSNFQFSQLLEDVRLIFSSKIEAHPHPLALTVHIAPEVPLWLKADPGKIRQVLVNLVSNAVKFTEQGSITVSASVLKSTGATDFLLAVDVVDTGCGIPEEEQASIFDLFFTRTGSGLRKSNGIGLGLPLSQRYAQAMGGHITVDSKVGAGSRFRFTFMAQAGTDLQRAETSKYLVHLLPEQSEYRILVVDDDPAHLDMMTTLLNSVGFAVETTHSIRGALTRLQDIYWPDVDLVLLDKCMPEVDGYEAIPLIRALPLHRHVNILIVTAAVFPEERDEALAHGADGYVPKPVNLPQLLGEISRVSHLTFEPAPAHIHLPSSQTVALKNLSEDLRKRLLQALRQGDIRELRMLSETIAKENPEAGEIIWPRVDSFDYETLQRLLTEEGTLT